MTGDGENVRTLVFNGWAAGPETWDLTTFHRDWTFDYLEQMEGLPARVASDSDAFVLVGFSMGGVNALRTMLDFTDKTRGLVLISTTPRMREDTSTGWKGLSERRLEALRVGTEMVFAGDPSPIYDRTNMSRGLEFLRGHDLREELRERSRRGWNFPVAVLHSERDGIVRSTNVDFFRSVFPQASVTMISGNEHVVPVIAPDAVDAAVEFIRNGG